TGRQASALWLPPGLGTPATQTAACEPKACASALETSPLTGAKGPAPALATATAGVPEPSTLPEPRLDLRLPERPVPQRHPPAYPYRDGRVHAPGSCYRR